MATGEWTSELQQWLQEQATEAGFDTAGVASADASDPREDQIDAERFAAWIDAGRAGEMDYLKRRDENGALLRSGVQVAIPWARSVIVCALNYNAAGPRSIDPAPPGAGWIARYAWSGRPQPAAATATPNPDHLLPTDYHDQLLTRLRPIESALHARLRLRDPLLRRHRPDRRARRRSQGRHRLDRQEHLRHQPAARLLASARRHRHLDSNRLAVELRSRATTAAAPAPAASTPAPPSALVAPAPDGRLALHRLSHHRKEGRHPRGSARAHRPPGLRLRHLPGRLPLESKTAATPKFSPAIKRRHARRGRR